MSANGGIVAMDPLKLVLAATALSLALASSAAGADPRGTRLNPHATASAESLEAMRALMKETARRMDAMSREMDVPADPSARRRMADEMREMSRVLDRMAALHAQPAHGPEDRAQLEELRRRLHAMDVSGGVSRK
jgi:hypothetical protein